MLPEAQWCIDHSGMLPKSASKCTTNIPQQQAGCFADETLSVEVMQWKLTQSFHSTSGWPDIFPAEWNHFPLLGESVLLWMMLQPTLDTPWLWMYARMEELDMVQLPPYSISSKALWNQRSCHHCQWSWLSNSNHHCPRQPPQTTHSGPLSPSLELPSSQQPPLPPTQWTRGSTPINHLVPVCVISSTVTHPVTPAQSACFPSSKLGHYGWAEP